MNEDLRMRLSHSPSVEEEAFFTALVDVLWEACRSSDKKGRTLVLDLTEIVGEADDTGYVCDLEDEFYMVLESRCDFGTRCDYLIHEMAHVDCWERTLKRDEDHCMIWGVSYAKMYRTYLNFYNEYWEVTDEAP